MNTCCICGVVEQLEINDRFTQLFDINGKLYCAYCKLRYARSAQEVSALIQGKDLRDPHPHDCGRMQRNWEKQR